VFSFRFGAEFGFEGSAFPPAFRSTGVPSGCRVRGMPRQAKPAISKHGGSFTFGSQFSTAN